MKNQLSFGAKHFAFVFAALLVCTLLPDVAHAQAATQDGVGFVQKMKDWIYGPIGLGIGFLMMGFGIVEWFRDGFKSALPYFGLVIVFYGIPALAGAIQTMMKA